MIELTTTYPCQRITIDPDFSEIVLHKAVLLSHISRFDWIDDFVKVYFCLKMTNHNGRSESTIWHPFNEVSVTDIYPVAEYNEIITIPEWAIEIEISLVNTDLLLGDEILGIILDFKKTIDSESPVIWENAGTNVY